MVYKKSCAAPFYGYSSGITFGCSCDIRILGSYDIRILGPCDIRTGCSYDITIVYSNVINTAIVEGLKVMSNRYL